MFVGCGVSMIECIEIAVEYRFFKNYRYQKESNANLTQKQNQTEPKNLRFLNIPLVSFPAPIISRSQHLPPHNVDDSAALTFLPFDLPRFVVLDCVGHLRSRRRRRERQRRQGRVARRRHGAVDDGKPKRGTRRAGRFLPRSPVERI